MRPIIGISCDEGTTPARERPERPALARFELKRCYPDAVWAAGGLPVLLPVSSEAGALDAAAFVARLDGLVVSGGGADLPPELYGEERRPEVASTKPDRSRFELAAVAAALEAGLPVLGVCGGMQVLNVARGGSLVQHIPAQVPGALAHQQDSDPRTPWHPVEILAGTRLAGVCGAEPLEVNSTHHQACARLGRDLVVSARAPDGVVEGIEDPSRPFVVGVQWHPESLVRHPRHLALYRALVEAARGRPRA